MKVNNKPHIIGNLFENLLYKLAFLRIGDLSFTRQTADGLQIISFSCRYDNEKRVCFSFGVGIRFPEVEELLGLEPEQQLFPTVGKPLSVMKDTPGYPEWCLIEGADVEVIRREVMLDINRYAIPFFDQYSTIEAVKSSLELEHPRHWFVLDPEQRACTLAAIMFVQGDSEGSLRYLDKALEQRSVSPLKKRLRLQKLQQRIGEILVERQRKQS